MKVDSFIQQQ
jgi:hypothetical protein